VKTYFLSPHCDDETLFGSFTIQREHPIVIICFRGSGVENEWGVTHEQRFKETEKAVSILNAEDLIDWSDKSLDELEEEILKLDGNKIYVPAFEDCGHDDHNRLHYLTPFDRHNIIYYLTYTQPPGQPIKRSESLFKVPINNSVWVQNKLEAMLCYKSQLLTPLHYPSYGHFLESQWEYYSND
jgi:LmbE family N-acetylglucosaminyl deacetylase